MRHIVSCGNQQIRGTGKIDDLQGAASIRKKQPANDSYVSTRACVLNFPDAWLFSEVIISSGMAEVLLSLVKPQLLIEPNRWAQITMQCFGSESILPPLGWQGYAGIHGRNSTENAKITAYVSLGGYFGTLVPKMRQYQYILTQIIISY